MWALIIFTFWSMSQSSDAGSTLSIHGFSSKETCEKAGKQIIEDAGNVVKVRTLLKQALMIRFGALALVKMNLMQMMNPSGKVRTG